MITKRIIADEVLRILAKGDVPRDFPFKFREVMLHVTQTIPLFIKKGYFENLQFDDKGIDGQVIVAFKNIPVVLDADRNEKYCQLPGNAISLPYGMGIYSVRAMKDSTAEALPVSPHFNFMISGMESYALNGKLGYYTEGGSVFFTRNIFSPKYNSINTFLIKIIGDYSQIDEDDALPIPADAIAPVVDAVVQKLAPSLQVREDKVPDNNTQS